MAYVVMASCLEMGEEPQPHPLDTVKRRRQAEILRHNQISNNN